MTLETVWAVFLVGTLGGFALELLHWYALRRRGRLPTYGKSPFYWMVTAGMMVLGGVVAVLYFGSRAEGILVFHVGASAPLLLQKLTTTLAHEPGAKSLGASPIDFMRW